MHNIHLINKFSYQEKRCILAIIANALFSCSSFENNAMFNAVLNISGICFEDTTMILNQDGELKESFKKAVLSEISLVGLKYLTYLLSIFLQTSQKSDVKKNMQAQIDEFDFDSKIKDNILEEVKKSLLLNKCLEDFELKVKNKLTDMILSENYKYHENNNKIYDIKKSLASSIAFSNSNYSYGSVKLIHGVTNTTHIFINGFLNDKSENDFSDWLKYTKSVINQNDAFFGFHWPSGKTLEEHLNDLKDIHTVSNFKKFLFALRGVNLPYAIGSLSAQLLAEWNNAKYNSEEYAINLYHFIKKLLLEDDTHEINIYGHSLGANLIFNTLKILKMENIHINNVYLLGGASPNCKFSWSDVASNVNSLYNFYSRNDNILLILYQTIEISKPIGLDRIEILGKNRDKVKNYDFTSIIDGHSKYFSELSNIIKFSK